MNDRIVLPPATRPAPLDAARLRARAQPWSYRVLNMVSTYLPVVVMGLLALGTWWLVSNTPVFDAPGVAAAPRHEPDYTMTGFTVQRFAPDGPLNAEIEGDAVRHYPDDDSLEIDNPRLRATGPDGQTTVATAQRALTSGSGSEVQLMGGARVLRDAPGQLTVEFRGEFLHAFLDEERVSSHLPVTMQQGSTRIQAASLAYDHRSRVVQARGRVRATFASPGTASPSNADKP